MVPSGWTRKKLHEIASTYSGGTPSRTRPEFFGGNIPWIKSGEVNQRFIREVGESITTVALSNSSAKVVPPNTVVVAMYGATAGKVGMTQFSAAINQAILAVRPDSQASNEYLFYFLEKKLEEIAETHVQGGQPNLNAQIIRGVDILLPPMPEQERIAEVLRAWDTATEKLRHLIRAKRERKRGLMQVLLTGKKRFKEFEGASWSVGRLGDFCHFGGGSAFKEEYQGQESGEFPFIKVSDMSLPNNSKYVIDANNWVSAAAKLELRARAFPAGSIVFAKVGAALLLNRRRILTRDTIIDNNMMAATPKEVVDSEFLYQYMLMVDLGRLVQDGAVPSVNQSHLQGIKVRFPGIEEQRCISSVLSVADDEIETLEKLLEAYKLQKRGLMQQLLTGKKRVSVEGPEPVPA